MAHRKIVQLAASIAVALCGAAQAQGIAIDTARGVVELPGQPQKIVVLDAAAADTLEALQAPIAGVPSQLYAGHLQDLQDKAAPVGTLFEPDYEAIAMLAPDLIIAGGRSSARVAALAGIAPAIDMTIWGEDHIGQSLARLRSYGRLTGQEARAEDLEAAFTAKLERARAAVAGRGNAMILMTNGPKVSVYGAGSRFGWLHTALDLPEAVASVDAQTHGEAVSFEFIAAADPDWLIIIDRAAAIGQGNQAAAVTLDNALVAGTTAWRRQQVVYLDAASVYVAGGGIQAMTATLEEVLAGFAAGG
ncbi:siderophore ABC transporter substrate-binding protein [Leisingera methylohalidivorans]|uniref:Iron ABC transporter substrate-binding protein n=1 Tax=Leisingera methylohalidivorans DSM 14336 TaxID=999552 RepID=V9VYX0_9RHOB|nr:siderophore ABC transporter substrate-binding protein [Leisingera methylohalidivorans]AHD02102.1 iron ABC transporter substrate-binding protein [Leisingera methylohalidivorans DSM 14336]